MKLSEMKEGMIVAIGGSPESKYGIERSARRCKVIKIDNKDDWRAGKRGLVAAPIAHDGSLLHSDR